MNRKKTEINNSLNIKSILNKHEVNDLKTFIREKNAYIQEIIRNTITSIKMNKQYEIFSNNDTSLSINILNELYQKSREIDNIVEEEDNIIIELLQKIIDKLSMIICGFGTKNIDDLLFISFGSQYVNIKIENELIKDKYDLIRKHIHPIGYKLIHWKNKSSYKPIFTLCANKMDETMINMENSTMFECYDGENSTNMFYQRIYGIRVIIQNETLHKTLIINGIVDDIQLECFSNKYIDKRKEELVLLTASMQEKDKKIMERIIESLSIKEILFMGNGDVLTRLSDVHNEISLIKNNKLDITIKQFIETDLLSKRNILVNLLLYNKEEEIQYICYLLYDLLALHRNDVIDNSDQTLLYDSLSWNIRSKFKDVIKYTMKCTNDMINKYDINRVSLEHQIHLLKVSDAIKEKAIIKLKEVKGKSDDMGSKAKSYLEGLIKIPFGIYKEEPVLKQIREINTLFKELVLHYESDMISAKITKKEKYNIVEMIHFLFSIKMNICSTVLDYINENVKHQSSKQLTFIRNFIFKEEKKVNSQSLKPKNENIKPNKSQQITEILNYVNKSTLNHLLLIGVYDLLKSSTYNSLTKMMTEIDSIQNTINSVEGSITNISNVLNKSIHSHIYAKGQLVKILGQWINGEQRGYCFGFEGSPGIGKTSLAKYGLSKCLIDENGESRPFHFIALGGSSNGSTLEGHGYTYVNSTWGKIVDILMESKCMNPIIYIDELDKVSNTENGKEIIGILIHLIDSTQNDSFQDKYFTGINIDLSKVLFIFSYNNPENIDKILLDRIHRIKFDNLSLEDKIFIVDNYLIPEINKNMGFEDIVSISDSIITYIITNYTAEPGIRKLKEILFDLYGEINIELLRCTSIEHVALPIIITEDILDSKYLNKYHKIETKKIHVSNEIGVVNGLWANSLGRGGIIPIQAMFFPSTAFLDLKLTGLQGDVMKESMNVAKTLAWDLTPLERKKELIKSFEETKCQGLHIHCPEGAVSKDGPSAGAAITVAIYSLFNNKPIINTVALTGEINLQGEITAIGGLDLKIIGGIDAGIKTFLYPTKNGREYIDFMKKYKDSPILEGVTFKEISKIKDACPHVFTFSYD
jgi:ATP-dependent Lon protease